MEFFRHCPGCGRRFRIKLESKKLVDVERTSTPTVGVTRLGIQATSRYDAVPPLYLVQDSKPVVMDIEDFQYTYKCQHCGHEWSEKHTEEIRENR